MKLYKKESRFPFGKYKGLTVLEVTGADPEYVMWAHYNIKTFKLNRETYKFVSGLIAQDKESEMYAGDEYEEDRWWWGL